VLSVFHVPTRGSAHNRLTESDVDYVVTTLKSLL
jgi:hypothetical protein